MLKEIIYNLLEFFSPLMVFLCFLFLYKRWIHYAPLRVLFIYFVFATFNLGFATYLAFINKPNIEWYNLHGFLSLATLSYFFYSIIITKKNKKFIKYLSLLGLLTYLFVLIIWDDNITFFSSGYSIGSLIIIICCLLYLKEAFDYTDTDQIHDYSIVWIVSSLLTYYLGSYLIHVTYKYITQYFVNSTETQKLFNPGELWAVNNVIYFFSCLFIIINLFKIRKKPIFII